MNVHGTRLSPDPTRALLDSGLSMREEGGLVTDHPVLDDIAALSALVRLAMPKHEEPMLLAGMLLARFGSFAGTLTASAQALRSVAGIGPYMLAAVTVFREAAIRLQKSRLTDLEILSDRSRLYAYLSAVLAREVIEQFHILFLDEIGLLIADEAQARGTVNHTPVYPREVVRRALELKATALILVHNHPSGDPAPSAEDLAMTRQVVAAAGVLGITVRDHVIVGNGRWLSFAESGLL
ncbi:MAG: DNA repair protein RadC [Acetobacter aceti]|uniref:JAB domain-containing protein n=1 Tax=Acetobacter aceti TaxID=435 RepID=UPI001EEE11E1|nr:DNA repair protein RadC [Acetobacter aceti]